MNRINRRPRPLTPSTDRPGSRRLSRRLVQLYAGLVLYALAIGPLVQVLMPRLSVRLHR